MTAPRIHPWNVALWRSLPPLAGMRPVMLLAGPAGIGKTSFAAALAHALLCPHSGADRLACGSCPSCRLASAGNHPDLRLLGCEDDAEEEEVVGAGVPAPRGKASRWIKVASVRLLADFLALSAHLGGRKVVVVEQAERLHPSAANAMLKTLEEPPPATHFLLVSGKPVRLPATVRSRCVTLAFTLPPVAESVEWLRAQGSARPEVALAQAGNAPLAALALDRADYWKVRDAFIDLVLGREDFDPVAAVDRLGQDSFPFMAQAMQRWVYDLLSIASRGPLRYNPDCAQILHRLAVRSSRPALLRFLGHLNGVMRSIDHPLNARLAAQHCLFAYRAALCGMEA
ncbi:MAG: DNA polymerase III subunit delta' [Burkholderiales bacterium]|nr:DNA polymerase III subunit delta' [Burkholderiales bacterium]